MKGIKRRNFMKGAVAAGFAIGVSNRVFGANDDVQVGVAGVHGRGGTHIREFTNIKGSRVTAICDPDKNVLESRGKQNKQVKKYVDVRKMIEDDDVDAVAIATTNHWHSLIGIWACQAKKDVYVEKPCSHNVFEGRKLVEAARKYNCIVQHGTQSRSSGGWAHKTAIARSGKYGKLLIAKGYCCKPRWSIGYRPIEDPPKHIDFNLWLGPAPEQPYHGNLVHYNWHWFWDTGNGDVGNQGVHQMDIARWGIGKTLPKSVVSLGGRWVNEPGFKDQAETPNQLISIFDYGDCLLLFETRGLVGKKGFPNKVDNEFYFEEGVVKNNKFYPKNGGKPEKLVDVSSHVQPGGNFGNFITCVKSRRRTDLNAEIEQGHLSSALCHLGNISYRMGKPAKFGEKVDVGDNKVVGDSIMTMIENTKVLGTNAENAIMQVGRKLEFDAKKEQFIGSDTANDFLTRPYRKPFVVPNEV